MRCLLIAVMMMINAAQASLEGEVVAFRQDWACSSIDVSERVFDLLVVGKQSEVANILLENNEVVVGEFVNGQERNECMPIVGVGIVREEVKTAYFSGNKVSLVKVEMEDDIWYTVLADKTGRRT